jgi:hypothetical protein
VARPAAESNRPTGADGGIRRQRAGWQVRYQEVPMYLARFSYDVLPVDRQAAVDFIREEVKAAKANGLQARLLVPLTRGQGGAALHFEVDFTSLEELDQFRHRGVGSDEKTGDWMRAFSEILIAPPEVEILRVDEAGR